MTSIQQVQDFHNVKPPFDAQRPAQAAVVDTTELVKMVPDISLKSEKHPAK